MKTLLNQNERLTKILLEEIRLVIMTRATGVISEDEMFHGQMSDEGIDLASNRALGANGKPDNWKASYLWYEESENVASLNEHHVHRDPIRFFEKKPQALVYYAMALEDDGYLDAEAQQAFAAAHAALIKLGNRDLATQFGFNVRLNQFGEFRQNLQKLKDKMDLTLNNTPYKLHFKRNFCRNAYYRLYNRQ